MTNYVIYHQGLNEMAVHLGILHSYQEYLAFKNRLRILRRWEISCLDEFMEFDNPRAEMERMMGYADDDILKRMIELQLHDFGNELVTKVYEAIKDSPRHSFMSIDVEIVNDTNLDNTL